MCWYFAQQPRIHSVAEFLVIAAALIQDSWESDFYDHEQRLMNIKHQVFQVSIDGSLSIDGYLLLSQHVIELHNTHCDCNLFFTFSDQFL